MNAKVQPPFRSVAFYVGLAQAVLWIALIVLVVHFVWQVVGTYEDFDMDLPAITITVISITDLLQDYGVLLAPFVLCACPLVHWAVVSWLMPTSQSLRWLWYGATWLLPFCVAGAMMYLAHFPLWASSGRLS